MVTGLSEQLSYSTRVFIFIYFINTKAMAANVPQMGHSGAKAEPCLADLAKPSLLKHNDWALAERTLFLGGIV